MRDEESWCGTEKCNNIAIARIIRYKTKEETLASEQSGKKFILNHRSEMYCQSCLDKAILKYSIVQIDEI